jgi:hypothetical protein
MLTQVVRCALLAGLSCELLIATNAQTSTMMKPPPVSGQSYRIETGMEERSNYITGGIGGGAGYIDNLYPGSGTNQLSEAIFLIQPGIAFDAKSARQHTSVAYNPTFIFYEPSSVLNESDHAALFSFEYRFTPRLTMDLSDRLLRASTGFSQIGSGGISGSAQAATPGLIVPFGTRFSNDANGGLSYQFSPHGMIGGSGNLGNLNYSTSTQTAGLYNSNSHGGSGFYNHRLSASQYLGAIYEYQQTIADSSVGQYGTQTHTINGFYTIYLTEVLSVSVAAGPQHYRGDITPSPVTQAWTPAVAASMGWQSLHTSFAAHYSRTVSGGGGLVGTFNSTSAAAIGRWQFARLWDAGLNVDYTINKNTAPVPGVTSSGGHTFATSLSLGHTLTKSTKATFRYDRIQNRYGGIASLVTNPSSDRLMLSISWQFHRPIGR